MCGIVGFISTKQCIMETALQKWFQQALFVDTLRGKDSTGMIVGFNNLLDQGYLPDIVKDVGTAEQFLQKSKTKEYFDKWVDKSFMVGHNRAATMGKVVAENAHPFQHGNISLVHNGTLDWTANIKGESSVDSEMICETFAVDDQKETLEKLEGAYALVWHDATDDTLNLARNSERPMYFGFSALGSYMLFASEEWMISALTTRYGCALGIDKVMKLAAGKWMKIRRDLGDLREYEVIDFKPAPVYTGYWYSGKWNTGKKSASDKGGAAKNQTVNAHKLKTLVKLGLEDGSPIAVQITKETVSAVNIQKSNYTGDCLNTEVLNKSGEPVEVLAYSQSGGLISLQDICIGNVRSGYENTDGGHTLVVDELIPIDAFCKKHDVHEDDLLTFIYGYGNNPLDDEEPTEDEEETFPIGEMTLLPDFGELFDDLDNDEVDDELELYDGPNNKLLTKTQFNIATGGVCVNCGCNIFPKDHQDIEWVNNGQSALCYDCSDLKSNNAQNFGFIN